jgi:hypothetical protein
MSPRRFTGPFRVAAGVLAIALVTLGTATSVARTASAAPPAAAPSARLIHRSGSAAYAPTPTGSGALASLSTEIPRAFGPEAGASARGAAQRSLNPDRSFAARHAATARRVAGKVVAGSAPPLDQRGARGRRGSQLLTSFDGINHRDQRTASGGNQFSVEPPDQGLCVGGGHVVEAVNSAFQVFNADGSGRTGVEALNQFFGYPPALVRPSGPFGPIVTDPSCLYDPTTRSFFLAVLTLDVVPASGAFTGTNHLDIAVAHDPTGTWDIYSLDATDDGTNGSPSHPHCPCLGDYPHLGVDAHGFYLTTNEYSFFGPEFNSAQVYAFSKRALARGDASVRVTQFDTTAADRGLNGFTVWPAQSPAAAQYAREAAGTEYFLSSNAAEEATGTTAHTSNSVVTWSLTNTESLDSAQPNLRLHNTRVPVRTYSLPPLSNQKAGPVPLAQCLNSDPCATTVLGTPDARKPEVESPLDSNDTRMQQVTYSRGRLYGALDTAVTVSGAQKAGIAWYIVRPRSSAQAVRADLSRQGQLGLAHNNLTYPAIGVNARGRGVMAFTLVGDTYYPSAAYAAFDGRTGAGRLFLAKAGLGPQDGFSGYKAFANPPSADPRPRWGDYGAAAVEGRDIWIASEYIGQTCTLAVYQSGQLGSCNGTRTALANWYTRISRVRP